MSVDLLQTLQSLEDDYPNQPAFIQKSDLREINDLRAQLGLPLVDARLKPIGVDEPPVEVAPPVAPIVAPDHTEARDIYQAYLKKIADLEPHREYADRVAKATAGQGMTPVRPLATMGTDGGPILCDHCGKPIVLEGGPYHKMDAASAWKQNPSDGWVSWILGGMVVEIQTNGTLRIYHGYPGLGSNHCCNVASRDDETARAAFQSSWCEATHNRLLAFFEHEFPDMTDDARLGLLNDIMNAMDSYDPGIGKNRPNNPSQNGIQP